MLLGYLARGASAIRLDAIGFLWKESGTTCLHLPQTHAVIKLWRALVDHVGAGRPAAHRDQRAARGEHLLLRRRPRRGAPRLPVRAAAAGAALVRRRVDGPAERLGGRRRPGQPDTATWFNFLASHDGIGLRATEGILDDAERDGARRAHPCARRPGLDGGRPDGTSDGLRAQPQLPRRAVHARGGRRRRVVAAKALAAHSILLAFLGVPAIYYHSLVGSPPDLEGMVDEPDQPPDQPRGPRRRPARRGAAPRPAARADLRRPAAPARRAPRARGVLARSAPSSVEHLDDRVFALRRGRGHADELLCVTNVTGDEVRLPGVRGLDVLTGARATRWSWGRGSSPGCARTKSARPRGVLVARLDRSHRALEPSLEQASTDSPEQG